MHPSVRDWLRLSRQHPPLPERSVLELARLIQRWQHHPGGPTQAPRAIRKRGQRARDQLVRHNLALVVLRREGAKALRSAAQPSGR